MQLQRISVKFFATTPVDLTAVVPVFHDWIKNNTVPGMLIDVHDYKHVPGGPGILLVGHEGDYALDIANGEFGISYTHKRKRESQGDVAATLRDALANALAAATSLEQSITGLTFDASRFRVSVSDRRLAPNTDATDPTVGAAMAPVAAEMFGVEAGELSAVRVGNDPAAPYCLDYSASSVTDLATLASNIAATATS